MPERKHQQEQDRTADQSKTAREQATASQTRDRSLELAQLHDEVAICQQRALNGYAREMQDLENRQHLKQQELMGVHAADDPRAVQMREADRKAEAETLERFQQTQREQVMQRQQLEQSVFQEQAKMVTDLQARQQREMDELQRRADQAGPNADHVLNQQRQQLETRQQQERERLDGYFRAQRQALQDHRDRVQAQMDQDQGRLQQALYEERQGTEYQETLKEVHAKQEAMRRGRDQAIGEELADFERRYQRVNDPENKMAQIGDVEVYRQQRRAIRSEEDKRLSEHEHIRARINLVLQTLDPNTQESPVDKSAYRDMTTLTIPRDMAVEKTKLDMELRDKLRESLKTGVVSEELIRDMDIQADIERTIQARDKNIADRLTFGHKVDDLEAITDKKIAEAAHLQQSELFKVGKEQTSKLLRDLDVSDKEINQYIDEELDRFKS